MRGPPSWYFAFRTTRTDHVTVPVFLAVLSCQNNHMLSYGVVPIGKVAPGGVHRLSFLQHRVSIGLPHSLLALSHTSRLKLDSAVFTSVFETGGSALLHLENSMKLAG